MKTKLKYQDKAHIQIPLYILIVVSLILSVAPLFLTLLNSLKSDSDIMLGIFSIPKELLWSNYHKAFVEIIRPMCNSVFIALVGAGGNVGFAIVLGYIFTRKEFYGKNFIFNMYIMILLVPSIVGMSVLYEMIVSLNLKDSYFAIWLPVVAGGQVGSLFLFKTFFRQLPSTVFEAAEIDGASDFIALVYLVLPLSLPIILLGFVGAFAGQYNDFLWPGLIITSAEKTPLIPVIERLSAQYKSRDMAVVYAMYMLSSIPLIVTTAISLKFFQSGDFASGMKL